MEIIEPLELEGTFEDHLVQLLYNEQEHVQLDQAAQGLIHSFTLKVSSDGASTTSLDSLFHCLTTLILKNFSFISNLNLPSFSLKPFPLVLSQQILPNSLSLLSYSPFRY